MLYVGFPLRMIWKLQLVQNMAAHVVAGAQQVDSIGLLPQQLHCLPSPFQVKLKVLLGTSILNMQPSVYQPDPVDPVSTLCCIFLMGFFI